MLFDLTLLNFIATYDFWVLSIDMRTPRTVSNKYKISSLFSLDNESNKN